MSPAGLVPIIDGHNDFAWAMRDLVGYDLERADFASGIPRLHTDGPRLRQGGVMAQFWSLWVPQSLGDKSVVATLEQLDFIRRLASRHADVLSLATDAASVTAAHRNGRVASLLGLEGGHSIDSSLAALRLFHTLGVRYLTLTHTESLEWADSATDAPRAHGLTAFGESVVAEMNALGMIVDLSHVADSVMHRVLQITRRPVIFSHSSARAVCDVPRNVPDDVLAALGANGGVCMVTFVPQFLTDAMADWYAHVTAEARARGVASDDTAGEAAVFAEFASTRPPVSIGDVVRHIEHVRDVAGVDAVGIGGDFDGTRFTTNGLEDVSSYPRLIAALEDRGWSGDDLCKLASHNVLRVLRENDPPQSAPAISR